MESYSAKKFESYFAANVKDSYLALFSTETVKQLGEHAGKCISAETAKLARKLIVGS